METVIGLFIFLIIYIVYKVVNYFKLENYDVTKVSTGKMAQDAAKGMSTSEIRRNYVNGKYDKDYPNQL
ncbi:MAG: hypothetical protein LUF26_06975 [Firmicutes bacterium]|nr:hypothetical protein [Bacillota bacterium]